MQQKGVLSENQNNINFEGNVVHSQLDSLFIIHYSLINIFRLVESINFERALKCWYTYIFIYFFFFSIKANLTIKIQI